jgi:hypothetical protein
MTTWQASPKGLFYCAFFKSAGLGVVVRRRFARFFACFQRGKTLIPLFIKRFCVLARVLL